MRLKILEANEKNLVLIIEDVDVSIVNAIRRAILTEVPTVAVEDVIFYENDSPLHDEILALRIGLIPIKAKVDLKFRDECECNGKGCPMCTIYLRLEKEGPATVYSHDIIVEEGVAELPKNIPIVKLAKNQRLKLEAEAILGRGKEHAKWQSGIASYKYYPEIKIKEECTLCKACVEECPRNVLDVGDDKIIVKDELNCTLCKACVEVCDYNAIDVKGNDRKFVFKVESSSSLDARDIFIKACDVMIDKAKELEELL